VPQWDVDFITVPNEDLWEIVFVANFLNIKWLLDVCCAKIASMTKGQTPEQIRQKFGIQNDFTPEDEAAIREENKCAPAAVAARARARAGARPHAPPPPPRLPQGARSRDARHASRARSGWGA